MSGKEFLETLQQIGYPKAESLSARSFDWMFDEKAVVPFLTWFCNTVAHQNVLNTEEIQSYEDLEVSNQLMLEGPLLNEAIECLSLKYQECSQEALQNDIERLTDDLHRYKKQKERLIKSRNTWSLHNAGLAHKLSKMSTIEAAKKQQYRQSQEQCHRASSESNGSLQRFGERVRHLCSTYEDRVQSELSETNDLESDAVFLSQNTLDAFHKAEDLFSRDLTTFTKRLFFEGVSDIAGGELSRYQLLEVSDPMTLLVKGQSEMSFQLDCQELTRLQALFPKSEGERLNALVQSKCASCVTQAADDLLRDIYQGRFPKDVQVINQQAKETKAMLSLKKEELRQVTEEEVPPLVRELATLQGNRILTGNYHLKLTRQHFFTSNQDKVLKYLVEQRSRNEFLTMAYEIEARNHRDVHRLMTAIEHTLKNRLLQYKSRVKAMSDPSLTESRQERGTIDTRDTATTRLHHILVPETEERQLFLSYSSMARAAETLRHCHDTAKSDNSMTIDKYNTHVSSLEKEVGLCNDTLYADSSTTGGQPSLMPTELREMTSQLDSLLHKLEVAVLDVVTDINNKKMSLKKDALMTKERQLFVFFHTNPQLLQAMVEKLEEHLEALQVK